MSNGNKERSPWVYVGCGCVVLCGLIAVAMIVLGTVGFRSAKTYVEDMQDPLVRNQEARDLLGAGSLPDGYNAVFFLKIPWLMKMTMLTDGPVPEDPFNPEAAEEEADNTFIFINTKDFGGDREELRDYLGGKIKHPKALENIDFDVDIDFDMDNVIDRGTLDIDHQHITYAVSQGEFKTQETRGEGVFAMLLSECPDDERLRLGIWIRRLESDVLRAEESPSATASAEGSMAEAEAMAFPSSDQPAPHLVGTPADRAALRRFLSNFDLCAS